MRASRWWLALVVLSTTALSIGVPAAPADSLGNSTDAKACQQDGWQELQGGDGRLFKNEGDCTSYSAQGGVLLARATLVFDPSVGLCEAPGCWGQFTGTGLEPLSAVYLHYTYGGVSLLWLVRYADANGDVSSTGPGGWSPDEGIFACGGVVSSVYLTGTTSTGASITSNVIDTSPC